jgi:HlyD family secretion protein
MKNCLFWQARFILPVLLAVLPCACSGEKTGPASYEFTNVRRGTLERTASSSGTINPVAIVKVLPRMSGKVEKVFVDHNDAVKIGDILAELNTDVLRLQREQQSAAVTKVRANYNLQQTSFRSQQILAERNLISEFELQTSQTSLENLAADLAVAEANLRVIETEINQFAYITSPIDGIVLGRNINVGDTVVSSSGSSSTSIFTLAENLREMQIEASVSELEVTSIYKGMAVRFTLESLPGRRFTGTVENLRLIPVVSNNVVSYTVIINVENHDGVLLPGMTCAVNFIVQQSEDVLLVPNAALRYEPSSLSAEQIDEMVFIAGLANMDDEQRKAAIEAREQTQAAVQTRQNTNSGLMGLLSGQTTNRPPPRPESGAGRAADVVMRTLWYINDSGRLEVIQVQTGISNGALTEIRSTEDLEGKQVILRERL